jgi:RNA polymerase sigma-70 factor (ECF subfamily)
MRLFKKNYKNQTDEELMALFKGGDRKAFEEIFERYSNFLTNYFFRKLWQDRQKAEDFTQELLTKIIHKPEQFDSSKNFKTWLFTIAGNMCKNEYKKMEIRKGSRYEVPVGFEAESSQKSADHVVDESDFATKLNSELEKLNQKHKEVFMMRHFDGLSLNEISEILQINVGTVKSRLHNTTKLLAQKLAMYQQIMTK